MKKLFTHLLAGILVLLLSTMSVWAQWASVQGRIVDENKLPLPGANIVIESLVKGTATNSNGDFTLSAIPAGVYLIKVSFIGYADHTQEVSVEKGQRLTLDPIGLKLSTREGDEIVIMGEKLKGQAVALNQQRLNMNITNIVSADQIGRFPDSNIGDAMKRIPGITVINDQGEARFGLIRGTEPRFNSVMINGERLPSAEKGERNVQLDLIPSDMIQRIEVNKALLPDMDADAIGGAVNLVTRAASGNYRLSGTVGSGYNFLSGLPMAIGSVVASKRLSNDKLGILVNGSYLNHQFGSDNIEKVWDARDGRSFLNEMQIRKYDIQRIRKSVGFTLDYQIGNHSSLFLRTLYNERDDYENRFRIIYGNMQPPDADGLTRVRTEVEVKGGGADQKYRRLEKQVATSNSISGKHLIAQKVQLDWMATYAYAKEDSPNERFISFRTGNVALGARPDISNPEFAMVNLVNPLNYDNIPFRRFQLRNDFTDERDLNGRFNLLIPLSSGDFASSIKTGAVVRDKAKEVIRNRGELVSSQTIRWANVESKDYSNPDFLANGGGMRYSVGQFPVPQSLEGHENRFGATFRPDTNGNLEGSFSASETINGAYMMLNQQLGPQLSVVAGIRLENTSISYTATQFNENNQPSAVTGNNSYLNILPGLHMKYNISDNTMLRAAWTNTLARPDYVDLAPSRRIDLTESNLFTGNPDLEATTSMNFDLMAEHYFESIGIISGSVFHKNIKNFIYATTRQNYPDPISGEVFRTATSPFNGPSASLSGFEIALQRQLDFLPGFMKGFGIYTNYTFNSSQADLVFYNEDTDEVELFNNALPGTSKHNFNASLSYENKRFNARISANYHSGFLDPDDTFIFQATARKTDFRYLDRQLHVDFSASITITPQWRAFLEVNNITNQPLRYYQGVQNRTMQAEYYNTRMQFGIKFDLNR